MVDFHADFKDDEAIPSEGPEHSTLVFTEMLHKTQKEAFIALGGFTGEISGNDSYLNSILDCLYRDIEISVLIINEPNQNSKAFQVLSQFAKEEPDRVKIYQADDNVRNYLAEVFKDKGQICHFAVFDNKMYRFEYDPEKFFAISNFDEPYQNSIFKKIFRKAIDILSRKK